jgi:hypothetical protein
MAKTQEPVMAITAASRKCAIMKLEAKLPDQYDIIKRGNRVGLVQALGHVATNCGWLTVKKGY